MSGSNSPTPGGAGGAPKAPGQKKRVGWSGDPDREGQPSSSSAQPQPVGSQSPQIPPRPEPAVLPAQHGGYRSLLSDDNDSLTPENYRSTSSTPREQEGIVIGRPDFDREELTNALTEILDPMARESGSPLRFPRMPRPALRRGASNDAGGGGGDDDAANDEANDETADPRQRQSEKAAKERADRLARSIEPYSAPVSRRASLDDDVVGVSDADVSFPVQRRDFAPAIHAAHSTGRQRSDSHAAAQQLVRSHARPRRRPSIVHRPESSASDLFSYDAVALQPGQETPTKHLDPELAYIPRPAKYRGGILTSLLKLYNDAEPPSNSGSEPGTPLLRTPKPSPRPSPRPSPPASGTSTPKRLSGLLSARSHKPSPSATGVAGLIESSSMFATPASVDIAAAVSEKIKREQPRPRRSKTSLFGESSRKSSSRAADEKIRITIHIAQVISRQRYLLKLCRALMMYGAPTHRLEDYMKMSARVLEIEGQFLYIPDCMIISFDDSSTHTTEVKLVRTPQGVDLGRLRDVHGIYKLVVHDRISVDEAASRLDKVMTKDVKFGPWLLVPMYGLASAFVAPFAFQGRFIDLPMTFLLGCIVGTLALVAAPSSDLYANVFEISAAVITSFLARALGSLRGGSLFCFSAMAQSSIALILPGYMVLCSSLELQSHNIVAGSIRMVYAMIYSLFLGYGITIGATIYGVIDENATSNTSCAEPLARPWNFLFVTLFTICLCIINQAKYKQIPMMVLISVGGYAVNSYSSITFTNNSQISSSLGALTVGVLANLYSRLAPHADRLMSMAWDRVEPRLGRLRSLSRSEDYPLRRIPTDVESAHGGMQGGAASSSSSVLDDVDKAKKAEQEGKSNEVIGYGLAAAAMLPAIFVQVPSGLAANGSLLTGINAADQITGNASDHRPGFASVSPATNPINSVAFTVLYSVIQVAIGITVGLFLSALLVYPLGKRRSALFSF